MANNTHYEQSARYHDMKNLVFFGNIELFIEWFWQLGCSRRNISVNKTKYTAESVILKLGSVGSRRVAGQIFSSNVHFGILSLWLSSVRVSLLNKSYTRSTLPTSLPFKSNTLYFFKFKFPRRNVVNLESCKVIFEIDYVAGISCYLSPANKTTKWHSVVKSTCSRLPRVYQSSVFWTNTKIPVRLESI